MRYILNSAVIGRPGHYEYKLLTELEAEVWLTQGRVVTRVGYRETAQFIEDRFGVRCPLNREPIAMQPGDEALVVRLKYRLPDPAVKGPLNPRAEDWEIGLLKRTAWCAGQAMAADLITRVNRQRTPTITLRIMKCWAKPTLKFYVHQDGPSRQTGDAMHERRLSKDEFRADFRDVHADVMWNWWRWDFSEGGEFLGFIDWSEFPIWIAVGFPGCIEGVATVAVNLREDFSVPFQNPKLKGTVSASGSYAVSILQRFGWRRVHD